ncbi:MAG: histidine phosphatase family protein [Mesorhizobium sp.]|uniref:histidine phosphatase family protein n=1 Tax=Mesorhizobium sp. TaxID=1871066 RepID=UPI00120C83D2|nr:histidine phosphatase family protein [Mesorhizobium sp.]TIT03000.1 MAG: histidine phosphatase family protein [Mesorhizobium sp.]TIT53859.1 MAG: histidine phosphatase family protein [Mesorhizobium sp.]
MRLILLRHGETLWNAEQRLQGHDNSDLSEHGVQQALNFAPYARALMPVAVVSSDLGQARHTAALIGCATAPSDRRLREIDMGEWTGRTRSELLADHSCEYLAWRAGAYTPIKGETWSAFRARVAAGLRDWLAWAAGDVLAVVHEGVVRAACHEFLDLPPGNAVPVTPGTATLLSFASAEASSAKLEGYNIGPFLPDDLAAD